MNYLDAKILIVDDQEPNALLLKKILKSRKYSQIDVLMDSREVSGYINHTIPDLILLDLKMPFMDGFQVVEQISSVLEENFVQVIMISAQDDHTHKLKALDMGIMDFIGKPFDNVEVVLRVNKAIELKKLHEALKQKNQVLQCEVDEKDQMLLDMQYELIDKLMLSAEFRDQTTGNHISRIGCFARHLAKLCGLSDRSANLIFHASKLHDIGKIGIPDEVLLKPGALNENEMKIMKEHTTKGAKILSGSKSEILSYAEKIALNHHERWDGQGYPNGIRGEEIDIYSRITSICDVYDALHSSRPYKEIWENKAIIDELNRLAGSALDPVLTKIFIDHIDDFYQIQSEVEGCS